jgi:hypothetical protein
MIYSEMTAKDAFDYGLKSHKDKNGQFFTKYFSIYEISKCRSDLASTKEEFSRIGRYVRGDKSLKYGFLHCTYEDKATWTKSIAAYNSLILGKDLVGVLHALSCCGVSQEVVDEIREKVQNRIPSLLALGESARQETRTEWKRVSKLLGTGRCLLDCFTDECLELVDWVINAIDTWKSKYPDNLFIDPAKDRQKKFEEESSDLFD